MWLCGTDLRTKCKGMKRFVLLIMCVAVCQPTFARFMHYMSYKEMQKGADLVVIATPLATKEAGERGTMPGGPDWDVVGLTTEFDVSAVLKGADDLKKFVLHHYRQKNPKFVLRDGPHFVSFNSEGKSRYLLFLIKESDGRYAPVSGQLDPALYSVLELNGAAR
jgi:hypothetical protein